MEFLDNFQVLACDIGSHMGQLRIFHNLWYGLQMKLPMPQPVKNFSAANEVSPCRERENFPWLGHVQFHLQEGHESLFDGQLFDPFLLMMPPGPDN